MEITTTAYRQLAAVEIYHHHFLDEDGKVYDGTQDLSPARKAKKLGNYDVREWLQIEPDAATRATMSAHGLVLKPSKTGFNLMAVLADGAAESASRKPQASLKQLKLGFLLKWADPGYAHVTALSYREKEKGEPGYYLFGNFWARFLGAHYPHLTLPLPPYRPATDYLPGDLVVHDGNHFLAVAKSKGVAPNNTGFWKPTDQKISYASRRSLQPREQDLPPGVWGKIELTGKSGLSNYGILTVAGNIKAAQVYRIHIDKM